MGKIREISLPNAGRIELWVGDITAMTAADGCDVLVVSAYPGDYQYAPRAWPSVIRSLANRGIPVAELGADPEIDLRSTTSCWLSRKMPPGRRSGFDRLLCFEPPAAHTAASTVGDIFRTLVPFVGPEIGIRDVAMPIVASGNMGVPREEMLTAILTAATRWMEFGLPLQRLRIFIRYYDDNDPAIAVFDDFARRVRPQNGESTPPLPSDVRDATVFISYAHADGRPSADAIRSYISAAAPKVRTLMDAVSIDVGSYWQSRIGDLIEDSNRVIFVVTEGFWQSKVCLEEYGMARVLDHERGGGVLFPIYALSCDLPLHFKILNYEDCREADDVRLRGACDRMLATLNSR